MNKGKNITKIFWVIAPYFSFLLVFFLSFRKIIFTNKMLGHNWDWLFPAPDFLFRNLSIPSSYAWGNFNLGSASGLKLSHFFPDNFLVLLAQFLQPRWVIFCLFFLVLFIAFLSFKKLLDLLIKNSQWNYLPSFLYAFSPFLFNDIIGGSWYFWISYAFIPLFFIQLMNFVKSRRIKHLFLFLISGIAVISSLQNFVLIEALMIFYFIYLVIFTKSLSWKQILSGYLFAHFVLFIFNLYWITPFSYSITDFSQHVLSASFVENFESVQSSNQDVRNIFSLIGYLDRNMYYHALPGFLIFPFIVSVFLLWIMLLHPLVRKKEKAGNYLLWLLALLASVIFIKGGNQPFSDLTMWVYKNIFLMRLFKSPQHAMLVAAFIIPILIGFSLNYYLSTRFKKIFIGIFSLSIAVWISGWWYTGDLGQNALMNQRRDYIDLYSLSPGLKGVYERNEKAKTKERVLFLPAAFSVNYLKTEYQNRAQGSQAEHVYLKNPTFNAGLNPFADKIENSFCSPSLNFDLVNYSSLFSVGEIIFRNDIYPSFTQVKDCWDPQKTKAILDSNPKLTRFLENDNVVGYRLNDAYFIPQFYTSKRIIYANQDIDFTSNNSVLGDYLLRSAVYLNNSETNVFEQFKDRVDKTFILSRPELVEAVGEKDILASKEVEYEYQTVKHMPNNFIWQMVLLKEKYFEWQARNNKDDLFRLRLMYANKRVAELEKFNVSKPNELLTIYSEKIQQALQLANENSDGDKKMIAHLKIQKTLDYNLQKLREMAIKNPAKKFPDWERTIIAFVEDAKKSAPEVNPLIVKYEFDIPQNGEYTLFMDDDEGLFRKPEANLDKWKLKINGQEIHNEVEMGKDNGWIALGKVYLRSQNGQKTSLSIDYSDLQPIELENGNRFTQVIRGWYPDTRFYITGSAQLATEDVRLAIDETLREAEGKVGVNLAKELMLFLKDSRFSFYVKSDKRVIEARLNFSPWKEKDKFYNESRINEIKMFPLYTPKIILKLEKPDLVEPNRLKEKPAEAVTTPKITFVKINPTKYRVKIEEAKNPYTLVFNQGFDQGWKLYLSGQGTGVSGQNKDIAASYFGGEIQERTQKMDFLDSMTFETLGKKSIVDDRHYLVNGYANSWYIKPEDINHQENYELIVEFWPQRLFYFGLLLSGLMIFGLLVVTGYAKVRRLFR